MELPTQPFSEPQHEQNVRLKNKSAGNEAELETKWKEISGQLDELDKTIEQHRRALFLSLAEHKETSTLMEQLDASSLLQTSLASRVRTTEPSVDWQSQMSQLIAQRFSLVDQQHALEQRMHSNVKKTCDRIVFHKEYKESAKYFDNSFQKRQPCVEEECEDSSKKKKKRGEFDEEFSKRSKGSKQKNAEECVEKDESDSSAKQEMVNVNKCRYCGFESETETIGDTCVECGLTTTRLVEDNEYQNHFVFNVELPTEEVVQDEETSYVREGFFNEWILRIQGQLVGKKIQTSQHSAIQERLTQRREDLSKLTHVVMREVLEELKLTDLYDDAIYLAHFHGGPKPPRFTQEQLNELRIMFKQMEKHFPDYKSQDQVSFWNYPYTIDKLCRIRGYKHMYGQLQLLKTEDRRRKYEETFYKMCADFAVLYPEQGWKYVDTKAVRSRPGGVRSKTLADLVANGV